MHHKQLIRGSVVTRLQSRVGSLVTEIYAGRAGGVVADGELNVILVDCQASKGNPELFSDELSAEQLVYHLTVQVVVDGPEPDLADGLPPCNDTVDELTVVIRSALTREWALAGGLGLPGRNALASETRLIDFRFLQDGVVFQPGGKGVIAHNPIQFVAVVVCPDGDVSFEQEP
ncbi:hypothetical protein [uncultured Methylobacterium sp.]|uniref:hypothetical protein n=1 Tax=uncultured Methylobacterium sp. TaxID=157278 RepID=UPI0035CA0FAE